MVLFFFVLIEIPPLPLLQHLCRPHQMKIRVMDGGGGRSHVMAGGKNATENAVNREKEVELLVADLREVLGVKLDRGLPGRWRMPLTKQLFIPRTSRLKRRERSRRRCRRGGARCSCRR
jgi:hypothetical protein